VLKNSSLLKGLIALHNSFSSIKTASRLLQAQATTLLLRHRLQRRQKLDHGEKVVVASLARSALCLSEANLKHFSEKENGGSAKFTSLDLLL
jgi:hypothetical protein